MKLSLCLTPLLFGAAAYGQGSASVGTGPYSPAGYITPSPFQNYTIYQPKTIPTGVKMPVLLWGESGCTFSGTIVPNFLNQVASQGIIIIANGPSSNAPSSVSTNYKMMITAMDWAESKAGKDKWAHMDATRIAVAGHSCGGIEAYSASTDKRVSVIGIFNSGGNATGTNTISASSVKKPIFYFLGGPTDIAYKNGEADYKILPADTPAWKGNLPVGHGATYSGVNGGKFGVAASYFFDWLLRGNETASSWFTTDTAAVAAGWSVTRQNLDKIKVTPI